MSRRKPIERLLTNQDRIDYQAVIKQFPWIIHPNLNCIVSTDSDGLLCGLLASHYLNWRVVGFCDTKLIVHDRSIRPSSCVFLDIEILRKNVRSIGQHMISYDNRPGLEPTPLPNCFCINTWRRYAFKHDYNCKYPLSTAHFFLSTIATHLTCCLTATGVVPFHFADGSLQNTIQYAENSLDWMRYLRFDAEESPFFQHLYKDSNSVAGVARRMVDFWQKRDELSHKGDRGDRITLTDRGGDGSPVNLVEDGQCWSLAESKRNKAVAFIKLLASHLDMSYQDSSWIWGGWNLIPLVKDKLHKGPKSFCAKNYRNLLAERPISMAISASDTLEYSLIQSSEDPFD